MAKENLIDFPYDQVLDDNTHYTTRGITFTVDWDTKRVNVVGMVDLTAGMVSFLVNENVNNRLEIGKTYKLYGCPRGGSSYKYRMTAEIIKEDETRLLYFDEGHGVTFTYDGGTVTISINVMRNLNIDVYSVSFNPMLVLKSEPPVLPNEEIVTGKKYRVFNKARELWERISYWTKASDVEFDDGDNLEEKLASFEEDFEEDVDNIMADIELNYIKKPQLTFEVKNGNDLYITKNY